MWPQSVDKHDGRLEGHLSATSLQVKTQHSEPLDVKEMQVRHRSGLRLQCVRCLLCGALSFAAAALC